MIMDLTQGSIEEKNSRAKKMMLYFGIGSLIMSFAGLTSAFIVSSSRPDWSENLRLPNIFFTSLLIIIVSSITFIIAKRALSKGNRQATTLFLVLTFILGSVFIYVQLLGFGELMAEGFYLTGPTSDPKASYIFLIAFVHILHVIAGLICLLVVIYNHFKQKYSPKAMLGFELAGTFWHFVDALWIYLFLFLYLMK